jgi:hypothetical protein
MKHAIAVFAESQVAVDKERGLAVLARLPAPDATATAFAMRGLARLGAADDVLRLYRGIAPGAKWQDVGHAAAFTALWAIGEREAALCVKL